MECDSVKDFWNLFVTWWHSISETMFQMCTDEYIFGLVNIGEHFIIDIYNYLLLLCRWFIYSCKKESSDIMFDNYMIFMKHKVEIEKHIMYKNGKKNDFDNKWCILTNL